jgi:hypothetical protein
VTAVSVDLEVLACEARGNHGLDLVCCHVELRLVNRISL